MRIVGYARASCWARDRELAGCDWDNSPAVVPATAAQAHSQVLVRCIQKTLQKARSGSIVPHPQGCCASLVVQDLGYACVENHGRVGSADVLAEPARQTKAPPTHHPGTISIAFTPSWHTRNQFFFGGCAPRPAMKCETLTQVGGRALKSGPDFEVAPV